MAYSLKVLKLTVSLEFDFDMIMPKEYAETGDNTQAAQDLTQRREHLVQSAADKIFSTLASRCPRLKVVVIESTWGCDLDDFAVRAFLKSERISLYGYLTAVGMPVEPCMVKHHEPCSEILEPDRFVFA